MGDEKGMLLFATPVTENMAHNYDDDDDDDGSGGNCEYSNHLNYHWIREYFELMVYNALIFNIPYSDFWKEAKRYYAVCLKNIFLNSKYGKQGSSASVYSKQINDIFKKAKKEFDAEKERIKKINVNTNVASSTKKKKNTKATNNITATTNNNNASNITI